MAVCPLARLDAVPVCAAGAVVVSRLAILLLFVAAVRPGRERARAESDEVTLALGDEEPSRIIRPTGTLGARTATLQRSLVSVEKRCRNNRERENAGLHAE
jgi:hypothetical protein